MFMVAQADSVAPTAAVSNTALSPVCLVDGLSSSLQDSGG